MDQIILAIVGGFVVVVMGYFGWHLRQQSNSIRKMDKDMGIVKYILEATKGDHDDLTRMGMTVDKNTKDIQNFYDRIKKVESHIGESMS